MLSQQDKESIIQLYVNNVPIKNIIQKYDISRRAIYYIIRHNGVSAKYKGLNENVKKNIIEQFISGSSAANVSSQYGVSTKTIYNILKTHNISYRHGTRKHFFNEKYFENVNSENCYWAGFISADGGVFKNTLHIGLNNRDKQHLRNFIKVLGGDHKIQRCKKNISRISICSKRIISDLRLNFKICENKTKIIDMPLLDDEGLIRNYIRGYFDGDGTVYMNPKKMTICFSIISGSQKIVESIKDNIFLYTGQCCGIYNYKGKYSINTSGQKAVIVISWLYKDRNFYLERKYEKYNRILKLRKAYVDILKDFKGVRAKIHALRECNYTESYIEKYFNESDHAYI